MNRINPGTPSSAIPRTMAEHYADQLMNDNSDDDSDETDSFIGGTRKLRKTSKKGKVRKPRKIGKKRKTSKRKIFSQR